MELIKDDDCIWFGLDDHYMHWRPDAAIEMANGEVLRSTFMLEIKLNVNGEHSGPLFVQKCSLPQGWEKILLGAPGCCFGKICLLPQARLQTATSFYQIENRVLQRTSRLTNSKQFEFSFQSCFSSIFDWLSGADLV